MSFAAVVRLAEVLCLKALLALKAEYVTYLPLDIGYQQCTWRNRSWFCSYNSNEQQENIVDEC
jgi:hypothetical protein